MNFIKENYFFTFLICLILGTGLSAATTNHADKLSDEFLRTEIEGLDLCIDVQYVSTIKDYLESYINTSGDWSRTLLSRSELYFPIFETLLKANNMPQELKYLPVIESSLRPAAKSRVGALGLWQFMPATGRMMGLKVNSAIDQRMDPWASTEGAIAYLTELNERYDDWTLALAAYNCGPGNVDKAIRRSGQSDFWGIRNYLPRETRRYVPKFIAAAYFLQYHESYGIFPADESEYPEGISIVQVFHQTNFKDVASAAGMDVSELDYLNPAYRRNYLPGSLAGYNLVMPSYFADRYLNVIDEQGEINNTPRARRIEGMKKKISSSFFDNYHVVIVDEEVTRNHRIVRGDNLYTLARNYGISLTELKRQNGISSSLIKPGQRLKIRKVEKVWKYIPIVIIPNDIPRRELSILEVDYKSVVDAKVYSAQKDRFNLIQTAPKSGAKEIKTKKSAFVSLAKDLMNF